MNGLALYVHLPWCVRKCPYCDFNSHQLKSARPDRAYLDALIRDFEAELPLIASRRIDTVFFGGGTPSLFSPDDFAWLLHTIRQRIEFAADAEITLPDPVVYRRDWQHYKIRLTFGGSSTPDIRELDAPQPPPG